VITLKGFGGGKRRPVNVFFAEMIIALLFFSISGAVILKVFSSADLKSRESARLERVIIIAQSIAEAYSESGDLDSSARLVFGGNAVFEENALLDEDTRNCVLSLENGSVKMRAAEKRRAAGAGELSELSMTFTADGEEIYSLSCSAYVRGGDADE